MNDEVDFMKMVALGNLSMLAQIAGGEIQAKPGEVAERTAWMIQYIKTGEGLVTDEAREIAERVRAALAPAMAERIRGAMSAG